DEYYHEDRQLQRRRTRRRTTLDPPKCQEYLLAHNVPGPRGLFVRPSSASYSSPCNRKPISGFSLLKIQVVSLQQINFRRICLFTPRETRLLGVRGLGASFALHKITPGTKRCQNPALKRDARVLILLLLSAGLIVSFIPANGERLP